LVYRLWQGTHWNSIQDVLESSTEFLLNWAMVQIWVFFYRFALQLQSRGKNIWYEELSLDTFL
jgi:hypothetical protein